MAIEGLLFKIRRGEGPFYSRLKQFIISVIFFNLPAPRIILRPLYELLIIWRFSSHFILEKLFYVPIFKARCEKCGRGLSLPNGIPWIEGNLKIRIGDYASLDNASLVSGRSHKEMILTIGDRTEIGHMTSMSVGKSITIGNDCLIAAGCFIADNGGHPLNPQRRLNREPVSQDEIGPIIIEDNVWIGKGSVILRGVTIGRGSIVAANSLVARSAPPYSILMGVPAKLIMSGIDRAFKAGGTAPRDDVRGCDKKQLIKIEYGMFF